MDLYFYFSLEILLLRIFIVHLEDDVTYLKGPIAILWLYLDFLGLF